MSLQSSSLKFTVRRCQPELIAPAKPTPHEVKLLSDIEDQDGFRFHVPLLQFYRHEPSMAGKDPVQIIRQALAETLVFYYPFAGRLREGSNRKLMVDCTAEGVIFIEADAGVRLDQFTDVDLKPPFPCFEEILYNVPGSDGITDCPLLLIQVTRLKCGGFILGIRLNHTMSDGAGIVQFMNAMAEIACGASQPSVPPIWQRELLSARNPPHVTCNHYEYEQMSGGEDADTFSGKSNVTSETFLASNNIIQHSFFFGPTEIATLRGFVPHHLRNCTTFELLTACLWRCRTLALQPKPEEEVRMMIVTNVRSKLDPPMPTGYYGNAFVFPAAITTARKLLENPFWYGLQLIMKAKNEVNEEYIRSVTDLMVTRGRPLFIAVGSCIVSDVRRMGFREVDFGWGTAVCGGPAKGGAADFPGLSFWIGFKNAKGEEGTIIPVCLPAKAMVRFAKALDDMLKRHSGPSSKDGHHNARFIKSSL